MLDKVQISEIVCFHDKLGQLDFEGRSWLPSKLSYFLNNSWALISRTTFSSSVCDCHYLCKIRNSLSSNIIWFLKLPDIIHLKIRETIRYCSKLEFRTKMSATIWGVGSLSCCESIKVLLLAEVCLLHNAVKQPSYP